MKNLKQILLSILLCVLVSFSLEGCAITPLNVDLLPINNHYTSSQKVFIKAWDTIKNEYVDDTYNHQDWGRWKRRYIDKIHSNQDAYVAIETMIESLDDRYTRFLKPSDFEEQDRSIDSKLFGIGVHISEDKDGIVVVEVIKDTPAEESGLKAGDKIIKVNNKLTKGLDLSDVAGMVRGKAGTKVKLVLLRDGKPLLKDVERREIFIKTVEDKVLDGNIAYIKISSFISQETAIEMASALHKNKNADGYIVDIRGNFGGLLPNAIFIASMFIKDGAVVSIVDKTGQKETINAQSFNTISDKPLIVLVNGASASASEILGGALKDHKRAKLVGTKTFGKGLVQKICNLPDGSGINVTIAKYLTPNGTDINKKGIEPDYKVEITEKDVLAKKDPQLEKAKEILKSEIKKEAVAHRK